MRTLLPPLHPEGGTAKSSKMLVFYHIATQCHNLEDHSLNLVASCTWSQVNVVFLWQTSTDNFFIYKFLYHSAYAQQATE